MYSQRHPSAELLETRVAPAFGVLSLAGLNGFNGFKLSGVTNGDYAGFAVAGAGDINGDNFDDVIIGAYGSDSGGPGRGASYVVFGKAGGFGTSLLLSSLNGTNGFRIDGDTTSIFSGRSVRGAGDVNGDGLGDLIIGAPNSGTSFVLFGKTGGFTPVISVGSLNGTNGFKINGADATIDRSGYSVSGAGDVNGDGIDDLIIGARDAAEGGIRRGASYVVFGRSTFTATFNLASLDGTNGFKLAGNENFLYLGASVSSAGDVNGDGFDDVIIGSKDETNGGRGVSYVVFGRAAPYPASVPISTLDGTNGFKVEGAALDDEAGRAVSSAGDVNGDGFDDLLIGAPYHGYRKIGAAYVVFGKSGNFAASLSLAELNGTNGFKLVGVRNDDIAGYAVSGAGDVNGDGFADILVGAHASYEGFRGATYLVFGKASGFSASVPLATIDGTQGIKFSGVANDDWAGLALGRAGDVNGDGFNDLLIGASRANEGGNNRGAAYVVFGHPAFLIVGDASSPEGQSGTTMLNFPLSLSTPLASPATVNYVTLNGTAQGGTDFVAAQEAITFPAGETNTSIVVSVNGDTTYESTETFTIGLFQPTNLGIWDGSATGSIVNDDAAPTISFSDTAIIESDDGSTFAQFAVSLSEASGLATTIRYSTSDGSARSGSDYTAVSNGTLILNPGEVTKFVEIEVKGDTDIESDETFFVNLSTATNATITDGQGQGTIVNDDPLPVITIAGESVVEGDEGSVDLTFTFTLSAASTLSASVDYATGGSTAAEGSDYTALMPGTLTFAPGETRKTITIAVLGDTQIEAHETVSIVLSHASGAVIAESTGTGRILNDETSVQVSDASVLEGHIGVRAMSFSVNLTMPTALPVRVDFASVDGTANSGTDYIALIPGMIEFAPGETTKTVTIDVIGDSRVEASETLSVLLSNAANAMIDDGNGLGTILDDDVTLVGSRKATFVDTDGESVTVKVSKGTLKVADFTLVPTGLGARLALIDFSGESEFAGAKLSISAKAVRGGTGDGLVSVGYLNATGIDLGDVKVKGDLGQLDAGDSDAATPALKSLSVTSLGTSGLSTQVDPPNASLQSDIAGDLLKLKVKTDIASGVTIAVAGRLRGATIGGGVAGSKITALGLLNPGGRADAEAIGKLSIGGDVTGSQILAGYKGVDAALNADAGIRKVVIGGDWIGSSLIAGATSGPDGLFGTEDDALISAGNGTIAKIASVLIQGNVSGTEGGADHFGFVAQEIGAFKSGGAKLGLTPGPSNDLAGALLGSTGDVRVREVVVGFASAHYLRQAVDISLG